MNDRALPPHRRGRPLPSIPGRRLAVLLTALSLTAPFGQGRPLRGQETAPDILRTTLKKHEAQLKDVHDYTVESEIGGSRQETYFVRREHDGHVEFVPVGPYRLALTSGALDHTPLAKLAPDGNVLKGLREQMVDAAVKAGLGQLQQALLGAADDQLADLTEPLLGSLEGAATPGGAGGDPVQQLKALADPEHLKGALLAGARRAGMNAAEKALESAAPPQVTALVDVLRGKTSPRQLLGALASVASGKGLPASLLGGGMPGMAGGGTPGAGVVRRGGRPGMPSMPGMPGMAGMAGAAGAGTAGLLMSAAGNAMNGIMMSMIDNSTAGVESAMRRNMLDLDVWGLIPQVADHATLEGQEEVDKHSCWVIKVAQEDVPDLANGENLRSGVLTLWIDRESYLPRRAQASGQARIDGSWKPVTLTNDFTDYQVTDGVSMPRKTTATIKGVEQAIPKDKLAEMKSAMEAAKKQTPDVQTKMDKKREEALKRLEEEKRKLAKMPPQQRGMVQAMLERQEKMLKMMDQRGTPQVATLGMGGSMMAQMEAMAAGEPLVTEVSDLKVNAGPPADLKHDAETITEMKQFQQPLTPGTGGR